MKRLTVIFLVLLLLLTGCAASETNETPSYPFYYLRKDTDFFSESGIIAEEKHNIHTEDDLTLILTHYLQGPSSGELTSPFPAETQIIEVRSESDTVTLLLSDSFARLEGIDLTLACCCIARTCMEITGCEKITFQCQELLLNDAKSLTVTADTMDFLDQAAEGISK